MSIHTIKNGQTTILPTDEKIPCGNVNLTEIYARKGTSDSWKLVWQYQIEPIDPDVPLEEFSFYIQVYWNKNNQGYGDGEFDVDIAAAMVGSNGKCPEGDYFIYFNNVDSPDGTFSVGKDNTTGEGEIGELAVCEGNSLPASIDRIIVGVFIYQAKERRHNFGMMAGSYVRVYNTITNQEILRYDLAEEFSGNTGVIVCEFYKSNNVMKLEAIGEGVNYDIEEFAKLHGGRVIIDKA